MARLLGELLAPVCAVHVAGINEPGAVHAAESADFLVLCYPTYFLRPSPSMAEFIRSLSLRGPRPAYLVTTYELYTENSLRACARMAGEAGMIVTGSAAIRAPGSDLTCVFPDWLCAWLYRFEAGFPRKLRGIARDIASLAEHGGRERIPGIKWYTLVAQGLQRGFLDGFFEWRGRMRILQERCTDCGACIARCARGAWERDGSVIRHDPERCELCTACIHHCPKNAIVLAYALRDNKRLDARHYAFLAARARRDLRLPASPGAAT